jgi:ring-1,2-phenylacetyl-CoA epoxidase subunit PaaB
MPHEATTRPAGNSSEPGVYEVFAQLTEGGPFEQQFSVVADSPELALVLAQENMLRRRPLYGLWVVPRTAIRSAPWIESGSAGRLPKTYRETAGYRDLVARWRRYQQEAITPDSMT